MGDELAWLGLLLFYGSIVIFYGLAHRSNIAVVGWTNRFMIAAAYGRLAYDNDVAGHQA